MNISRDTSIEKWFFEEVRQNWGKEAREGIHLTDLLYPRKAYFQRVSPKYPTDEEIMYFISGRGHEGVTLRSSGYQHGQSQEVNGIKLSPDFLFNFPMEWKTRRRGLAKEGEEEEIYKEYLRQLQGYCALLSIDVGWLGVNCLLKKDGNRTKPEIAIYKVEFTSRELLDMYYYLMEMKERLVRAIANKEFNLLPECPKWMCSQTTQVIVRKPLCKTCQREFRTDWGLRKHRGSIIGKGHEVISGEYEEKVEAKCKWFKECK